MNQSWSSGNGPDLVHIQGLLLNGLALASSIACSTISLCFQVSGISNAHVLSGFLLLGLSFWIFIFIG